MGVDQDIYRSAQGVVIKTPELNTAPSAVIDGKRNLIGLTRDELSAALAQVGAEKFRAKQIFQWLYHHGVTDFDGMTNIAKPMREKLAEHFVIARPTVHKDYVSIDGTRKWLLDFPDENRIEMVHIPETDRGTLCVSSQVGCTLSCTFCHTGTQRLVRNLSAAEIVGQVMVARDTFGEWPTPQTGRKLSNIVMMGMGEPLYNYDEMAKALKLVMDGEGIAITKRKITLSTSGVVPMMEHCGQELGVNLAISLHAVTNELRSKIVPINRKWPIEELMAACRRYYPEGKTGGRRITFEYVMLKDVNDSDADARALVKLLKGIPAKVNLIPFNPWPGSPYERSTAKRIEAFARIVHEAGYPSPVRTPRGDDILAACGQLKSDSELKKGEKVRLNFN